MAFVTIVMNCCEKDVKFLHENKPDVKTSSVLYTLRLLWFNRTQNARAETQKQYQIAIGTYLVMISGSYAGAVNRCSPLIVQNKPTKPRQLTLLPHQYRPLPHRCHRVMTLPPHLPFPPPPHKQRCRPLSPTPARSPLPPLPRIAPPHRPRQYPLYRATAAWPQQLWLEPFCGLCLIFFARLLTH